MTDAEPAGDEARGERLEEIASRVSASRELLLKACAAHDPGQRIVREYLSKFVDGSVERSKRSQEAANKGIELIDGFGRQELTLLDGAARASMSMNFALGKLRLGFLQDVIDAFSWSQPDDDRPDDSPMLRLRSDMQHHREARRQIEASSLTTMDRAIAAGESVDAIQDTAATILITRSAVLSVFEGVTLETSLYDALTHIAESLGKRGDDPQFAEVTAAKRRMIFDRGAALLYGLIDFIPIAKDVKTAVDLGQTLMGDGVDTSPGATDTMQRLVENLEEWIATFDEFAQLCSEETRTLDEIGGLNPSGS